MEHTPQGYLWSAHFRKVMATAIQQLLQKNSDLNLKLRINDNRSTMLSVKWEPDCTRVSLHRIFLQAPDNVMDALACYLRRKDKNIAPSVKAFIADNLKMLDYSGQLNQDKLVSQGSVYNLETIYNQVNQDYFSNKLKLNITWFGSHQKLFRSRVTFGLYHDPLRLIKINRLLDRATVPEYLVAFVVYHEMLHHVCPDYFDKNGCHHIHTKEFKEKEALFSQYHLAQSWIKKNQASLFI